MSANGAILRAFLLDGLGRPQARFSNLRIDCVDSAGAPRTTGVFLDNGGGKTSMLRLLFSVLHPGKREFIDSTGTVKLAHYVDARDVGHVVLEWDLFRGHDRQRWLTGMVLEWREQRQSPSDEHLLQRWWRSRLIPGVVDLEHLPVDQLVVAGQRCPCEVTTAHAHRRTIAGFIQEMQARYAADADVDFEVFDGPEKWRSAMQGLGLDTELFRYQAAMNGDEAAAEDGFDYKDTSRFIDFFLKMVSADGMSKDARDLLAKHAEKLQTKDALELERRFCVGGAAVAEPYLTAACALEAATRALADTIQTGLRMHNLLATRARDAEEQQRADNLLLGGLSRQLVDLEKEQKTLEARVLALGLAEVRAQQRDLKIEQGRIADGREALKIEIAACDAVAELNTLDSLKERHEEILRLIDEAELKRRPLTEALHAVAERLLWRWDHDERVQREELALVSRDAVNADEEEAAASVEIERLAGVAGGIQEQIQSAQAVMDRYEADIAERRDAGVLLDREAPAEAAERLGYQRTALHDEQGGLVAHRTQQRAVEKERGVRRQQRAGALERLREIVRREQERLDVALKQRQVLSLHERVVELSGAPSVEDLDVAAPMVLAGLGDAIAANEEMSRVAITRAREADLRRRAILELRILPASKDVTKVLDALSQAGIEAWPGWRFIADAVPRDRQIAVIRNLPAVANGVVLKRSSDAGKASTVLGGLDAAALGVDDAIAVGTPADVEAAERHSPAEALVIVPNPARWDEEAAQEESERLDRSIADAEAVAEQARAVASDDRELRGKLTRFLEEWPASRRAATAALAAERAEEIEKEEQADAQDANQQSLWETALGELEARLAEIGEELPLIGEYVAIARQLVTAGKAAGLAGAQLQLLPRQLSDNRNAAQVASERRDALKTHLATLRQLARQLEESVDSIERGRSEVVGIVGEIGRVEDDRHTTALQAAFEERYKAWSAVDVDATLQARFDVFSKELTAQTQKIDGLPAAVRERAWTLLVGDASVLGVRGQASGALEDLNRRHDALLRRGGELDNEEAGLVQQGANLDVLDDIPEAAVAITTERSRQATALVSSAERLDGLLTQRNEVSSRTERLRREKEQLDRALRQLDEALEEAIGGPVETLPASTQVEAEELLVQAETTRSALVAQRQARTVAQTESEQRRGTVQEFASRDDFAPLLVAPKKFLREISSAEGVERLEFQIKELRKRGEDIERDLAEIEKDATIVVEALYAATNSAVRDLEDAGECSRMPEGLGEWAGESFLSIAMEQKYRNKEQGLERIRELVERITQPRAGSTAPEIPPAAVLLSRAVRSAVRERFSVLILKPNARLAVDRVSVEQMGAFSGGERVVAAIAVYCTLARLRSRRRGSAPATGTGTLFLDNPFGKLSEITLLEIVRQVSDSLGVHLIFPTHLATPNVMRIMDNRYRLVLRQESRQGTVRMHVTAIESQRAEPASDEGQKAIAGARLVRVG